MEAQSMIPTDCLVLFIREYDIDTNKIDSEIFIFYDILTNNYYIRGSRGGKDSNYIPYSFSSREEKQITNFISLLLDFSNNLSIELYNFYNLPSDSNEIEFGLLKHLRSKNNELVAYDNVTNIKLRKFLKILKNINNPYYENLC